VFVIIPRIHLEDLAPRPTLPSEPKKGTDAAKAGRVVVPPRVTSDLAPRTTPDPPLTIPPDTALPGSDLVGEGVQGVGNGGAIGAGVGTGDGEAGPGEAAAVDPVYLTGDMVRPVLLSRVEPSYPQVARRAGLGGRVTVRAVIAEDGSVDTVEVLASTNSLFNEAAVDAVRKWRYRPARMNGGPVRVYFSVVVDFLVR
jgi:protein TonB